MTVMFNTPRTELDLIGFHSDCPTWLDYVIRNVTPERMRAAGISWHEITKISSLDIIAAAKLIGVDRFEKMVSSGDLSKRLRGEIRHRFNQQLAELEFIEATALPSPD